MTDFRDRVTAAWRAYDDLMQSYWKELDSSDDFDLYLQMELEDKIEVARKNIIDILEEK